MEKIIEGTKFLKMVPQSPGKFMFLGLIRKLHIWRTRVEKWYLERKRQMGKVFKNKNFQIIIFIFIISVLFTTVIYASNSPEYSVNRQGRIKITSEGIDPENYINIWWHPNAEKKYDVEYAVLDESDNVIDASYIEVSVNDGSFTPLDNWVCFLAKESNASPQNPNRVNFRINKEAIGSIPNGTHKLWLVPRKTHIPENAQGKPFWIKLKIVVDVSPEIAIEIDEKNLRMNITNPTREVDPVSTNWYIYTLNDIETRVNVTFESRGFKFEGEENLNPNEFFSYIIKELSSGTDVNLDPGTHHTFYSVMFDNKRDFFGEIILEYFPRGKEGENNWYELKAGEYKDVITITVSGDG